MQYLRLVALERNLLIRQTQFRKKPVRISSIWNLNINNPPFGLCSSVFEPLTNKQKCWGRQSTLQPQARRDTQRPRTSWDAKAHKTDSTSKKTRQTRQAATTSQTKQTRHTAITSQLRRRGTQSRQHKPEDKVNEANSDHNHQPFWFNLHCL